MTWAKREIAEVLPTRADEVDLDRASKQVLYLASKQLLYTSLLLTPTFGILFPFWNSHFDLELAILLIHLAKQRLRTMLEALKLEGELLCYLSHVGRPWSLVIACQGVGKNP